MYIIHMYGVYPLNFWDRQSAKAAPAPKPKAAAQRAPPASPVETKAEVWTVAGQLGETAAVGPNLWCPSLMVLLILLLCDWYLLVVCGPSPKNYRSVSLTLIGWWIDTTNYCICCTAGVSLVYSQQHTAVNSSLLIIDVPRSYRPVSTRPVSTKRSINCVCVCVCVSIISSPTIPPSS